MGSLREDLEASGLTLVETHISWVFLGEREVFKVKRPVALGFLDFSTVAKRRRACEDEVRLNRRLAPAVYLGVVPITRDARGRHMIGGEGAPRDWAVRMVRLPDADRADLRLAAGRLGADEVRRIAERLAAFHAAAPAGPETARYGTAAAVRFNVEENFRQTRDTIGAYLAAEQVAEVEAWQRRFLDQRGELFAGRIAAGRVRDGHGDLRLEHVYLDGGEAGAAAGGELPLPPADEASDGAAGGTAPAAVGDAAAAAAAGEGPPAGAGGVTIVDCIEFNDRLRFGDVAVDVAFLSMDLAYHGRVDLAERFLADYARAANDYDLYPLIDFYESYRAFVRAKVASMVAADREVSAPARERAAETARRYYLLALASERRSLLPPRVVAVGGILAAGKSTIARALSAAMGAPVVEADRTRKHLAGVPATVPLREPPFAGAYAPAATEKVYAELFRRAGAVVASGRPVVLDASFRSREARDGARRLAGRLGVPFTFVECRADAATCRRRLARRERETGVSDGRLEIFDAFLAAWQAVGELPPGEHLVLDTSRPLAESLALLRRRLPTWPDGLTE